MGKNRKQKSMEYHDKYSHIPINYEERLSWMYDSMNISDKKAQSIYDKRSAMLNSLYYKEFNIKLFEEPEGTQRSRFRLINRKNIANMAMSNSSFVHVYSPHAKDDHMYMKRVVNEELYELDHLIHTPCIVEYNVYLKTPSAYNMEDTFLAEIGLIRPIVKPDWDNIGKKYSDMYNHNIWLDDTLVISGTVNRYYSILPRVEINLRYLNMLYNKHQYNTISKRVDCEVNYFK
ncbi:MAG: RusA family crossover junction endodeoxyribonuclease [Paraclostridium sp.]